jgi:hypothetical protein
VKIPLGTNREPEYRRRIREKAEKDEYKAEDERQKATERADIHEIVTAIKAIGKKYDRESDKHNARHKWDRLWEVLGVFGLWLAAAVGATAIWIGTNDAYRQRQVTQGQLKVMRDNFTATERPWISIDTIPPAISSPLRFDNGNISLALRFVLRNSGRTPAIYVSPNVTAILSTTLSIHQIVSMLREYCENNRIAKFSPTETGILVPPGRRVIYPRDSNVTINRDYIDLAKTRIGERYAIIPYIGGCINYQFTFGERVRHQAGFIYQLIGPETQIFLDAGEIPAEKLQLIPQDGEWAD